MIKSIILTLFLLEKYKNDIIILLYLLFFKIYVIILFHKNKNDWRIVMNNKKIVTVIASVSLIFASFISSYADEISSDIFEYTVENSSVTITGVKDVNGKVVIPEKIDNQPVTKIDTGAFSGTIGITEVIVPDSVTEIGSMAFAYNQALKTVHLSANITEINDGTFHQCPALIGITIPDGVKTIGANAFILSEFLLSVGATNSVTYIENTSCDDVKNFKFYCNLSDDCPAYLWAEARNIECEELIKVYVNDKRISFDQSPVTEPIRFRTLVPLRSVLEEMGAEIEWFDDMEYAGITINGYRLLIKANEEFMMVNGKTTWLTCPAIEYNGRLLLPIRDVVQAVGGKVSWDEHTKEVKISYNN